MPVNRLIKETSPYLLQHAHNPVDWYPWGEEALAKARREDKPIFLSIGYSACHWCHVMEHESFEDPETAQIMNENFVNIKVDREERPDLDSIYMEAVQAMTGSGGWPMTVFLTPKGDPFYGGTYFPPAPRYGSPSFRSVLLNVAETYRERRGEVREFTKQIRSRLERVTVPEAGRVLVEETLEKAFRSLSQTFDQRYGGFGAAPKFPPSMSLEFLLRVYRRWGHEVALDMVETTLTRMARGGVYDQLGGGFHRYSVDAHWLVPHFEKMLYDNALLSRVYLHAYQVTGNALYRRVVEETLDYVAREMTDPLGGFYSTQDADTEGEEGKFYVWTPREVKEVLGSRDGDLFCRYFDVTEGGNFEGKNILNVPNAPEKVAEEAAVSPRELGDVILRGRRKLFEVRGKRVRPGRDEKVLTAWNGLMLASFAEASWVLDRRDYLAVAQKNAGFVLSHLRDKGRLLRTWKGRRAKLNGYLVDYSFLADGLLALYQADFDVGWFVEARALADVMLNHFRDESNGLFFDTSDDHEELIARPRSLEDGAIPSGISMAVRSLLLLDSLTGEESYREAAVAAMAAAGSMIGQYPRGFSNWLSALDFHLGPVDEVAIIGGQASEDTARLVKAVRGVYRPNLVVAWDMPEGSAADHIPLLVGREERDGKATAYVCQAFSCRAPIADAETLARELGVNHLKLAKTAPDTAINS
ncbi:MAG: thioredoxin domain-containing protein [Candidatus Geothermarchaeales archaeon]